MKKSIRNLLSLFLFLITAIPLWSQQRLTVHAGIGLVGYNEFGDGTAITSDVHIPLFRSVYLAPTYSQISFRFFKRGFAFHERDITVGDLKKSFGNTSDIREQTTSFRLFLYVNPFEWFPHRAENMDLKIGMGFGHFQILYYSYILNGQDVKNEMAYIRAENNFSVRIVYDYYLHQGYSLGLTLGYEPAFGDYHNFNPFFTVNFGIPLQIHRKATEGN